MDNNSNNIFGDVSLFSAAESKRNEQGNIAIKQEITHKKQKYINDFDSDLILENIDKKTKNKAVKINLKINTIERTLSKINEELSILQLLNLEKDQKRKEELTQLKSFLEYKLKKFKKESRNFGVIYSLWSFFEDKFDFTLIKSYRNKLSNEIKKYDKLTRSYLKSNYSDLLPFKW